MKNRLGLIWVILALVHYGASEPRQANAGGISGNSKKTGSKNAAVAPQNFAVDQIFDFFNIKKEEKPKVETKQKGQTNKKAAVIQKENSGGSQETVATDEPAFQSVPSAPRVQALAPAARPQMIKLPPKPFKIPVSYGGGRSMAVPPPVFKVPSIVKTAQDMQKIINLNKNIEEVKKKQAEELEKAKGQELVHKTVLKTQEKASLEKEPDQKTPTEADLLAQEKLRMIHEGTQSNAQ